MQKIKDAIIPVLLILFLYIATIFIFAIGLPEPDIVIHKTMNHNQSNIVIISTRESWIRFLPHRKLYADIWLNNKKTSSYYLSRLSIAHEYDERIKDITILPQENKIKVEFIDPNHSKSRTGVDLYKIADD